MADLRPRPGVRRQATVAAAAVVAAALLLGGAGLVLVLQRALTQTLQDSLTGILDEDASVLAARGTAGLELSERDEGPDNVLVQVISRHGDSGSVVYTSRRARRTPVTNLSPQHGQTLISGRSLLPRPSSLQEPLVVARRVDHAGAPYVLVASASQSTRQQAVLTTATLLSVAVPL